MSRAVSKLWGSGDVTTERWLPFGARSGEAAVPSAFVFTVGQDGSPSAVHRPAGSGECTEVGYAWAWYRDGSPAGDTIVMTRRIHVDVPDARPGDDRYADQVAALRRDHTDALEKLVNERHYRLPALQPGRATGPQVPGPVLRAEARFVDSPEAAHTVVQLRRGRPGPGRPMRQDTWFTGVHPAALVHEFVHGLGVRDDQADPRVLLTPGGRGPQTVAEGESSLMGPFHDNSGTQPSFTLTSDHLQQIADVLAPYLHRYSHTPTPTNSNQPTMNITARPQTDNAPAVNYDLIHPTDKNSVVESKGGEALYHFTEVSPELIFREGIKPRDPSKIVTVFRWQKDSPASQFVSTTRNDALWSDRMQYRYDIDPARHPDPNSKTGVDVNATIQNLGGNPDKYYKSEDEVAFTGVIPPEAIIHVRYYGPNTAPLSYKQIIRTGTWDVTGQKVVWTNQDTAPALPAGWGNLSRAAAWQPASSAARAAAVHDSSSLPSIAAMRPPSGVASRPSAHADTPRTGHIREEPQHLTGTIGQGRTGVTPAMKRGPRLS
ncbi:hypothetical protein AAW14_27720 [Streptomyces hygroscopicus]|nr:hypothetical protein [Streptomyces hygroscopicus]